MAPHALNKQIAELFNSQRFSDVKITCGYNTWYAHKNVICTQSAYFEKAFEGEFKEAEDGVVHLDENPSAVDAVLKFLYTGDYDDVFGAAGRESAAIFNVEVFEVAERLFVDALLTTAAKKFFTALVGKGWNPDTLAKAIERWDKHMLDPNGILREHIVKIIVIFHRVVLTKDTKDSAFRRTLGSVPTLAAEVASRLSSEIIDIEDEAYLLCPGCQSMFSVNFSKDAKSVVHCPSGPCCGKHGTVDFWSEFEVEVERVETFEDE